MPINQGDLIIGGTGGSATTIPKGTAGQVVAVNAGGTTLEFQTPAGGSSDSGIGFRAKKEGFTVVAGSATTISGYTEEYDNGGTFNNTTGWFTAPSNGYYLFTASMYAGNDSGNGNYLQISIDKNAFGTTITNYLNYKNGNVYVTVCGCSVVYLLAGETLSVRYYNPSYATLYCAQAVFTVNKL